MRLSHPICPPGISPDEPNDGTGKNPDEDPEEEDPNSAYFCFPGDLPPPTGKACNNHGECAGTCGDGLRPFCGSTALCDCRIPLSSNPAGLEGGKGGLAGGGLDGNGACEYHDEGEDYACFQDEQVPTCNKGRCSCEAQVFHGGASCKTIQFCYYNATTTGCLKGYGLVGEVSWHQNYSGNPPITVTRQFDQAYYGSPLFPGGDISVFKQFTQRLDIYTETFTGPHAKAVYYYGGTDVSTDYIYNGKTYKLSMCGLEPRIPASGDRARDYGYAPQDWPGKDPGQQYKIT
ncbi:hypothetical protein VHEMI02536 [[Torrubiella] hemipterigena]|uniref:Uncharacterized protein n=1 Tax=[Torrubiella] hemipterigena TaxID=1531966 RepID=A0A0A1T8G2_9HYPO|nr:hypothetical protein VHEMI02536 [[Torrubiella] hemipterigena]